jgi:hypothetical protein
MNEFTHYFFWLCVWAVVMLVYYHLREWEKMKKYGTDSTRHWKESAYFVGRNLSIAHFLIVGISGFLYRVFSNKGTKSLMGFA